VSDRSVPSEERRLPQWHGEVLEERRRLVKEGKLKFLDFDEAMADLRREFRDNPPAWWLLQKQKCASI
jgi:Putative addiction module component